MSPAVTVAIPTFNRRETLRRAIESALDQTYEDLEVLVSDNASTDGTSELLADLRGADARIRIIRQPRNIGMVANLDAATRLARGDSVMLLADDDWLAPDCVENAQSRLGDSSSIAATVGRVAYVRDGKELDRGQPVPLTAADPSQRVRDYFAAVSRDHGNSWLYALTRRNVLERLSPLRNVLAFDWLRVAELAFCGRIDVSSDPAIFREAGGVSETTARNVRESGLPAVHAKAPHLVIAKEVFADIGWRSPTYGTLSRRRRLALATACATQVPARNVPHVLFHLAPTTIQRRWHELR